MLDRFFNQKPNAALPEGQRIFAVGDIHGCISELDELLAKIDAIISGDKTTAGTVDNTLIFLGDYVDRGPDSKAVIDRLLGVSKTYGQVIFLKGNHEAAMLDFLDHPDDMFQWLDWGGEATLASYGVDNVLGRAPEDLAAELRENLPASHEEFLRNLTLLHQAGDYIFVHAGLRPGVALDEQQEEDLLWIRGAFHNTAAKDRPAQTIVHGHQPLRKPLDAGWRVDVDTGACWSGVLTALMIEGSERRFVSTTGTEN